MGSPPPARGARQWEQYSNADIRITPACAGSTGEVQERGENHKDHPRLRGEHDPVDNTYNFDMGSPPPARGAPGNTGRTTSSSRITPACAGSTPAPVLATWPRRDHPRLRGEHLSIKEVFLRLQGSPPPARGALNSVIRCDIDKRITPACAGSTVTCKECGDRDEDHPRLRGEHITA